jgi:hypothetical protein
MDRSKELMDAISINKGRVDDYLQNKNVEFKQKQIKDLISDEEEDDDGINWQNLADKKDM